MRKKERMTEAKLATLPGYLPKEKRHCVGCQKLLRPNVGYDWTSPGTNASRKAIRIYRWGWGPANLFCTLKCAYAYACFMFDRHGTRLEYVEDAKKK